MNETMALFLASKTLAEWTRSVTAEPVHRAHRSPAPDRRRGWLRAGRIAAALGLARRPRPMGPAPAAGPQRCDSGCGA